VESVQDTGSNRSKTVNSVFIDQLRLVELFAPLVSLFFGSMAWAGDLFCHGGRKLVLRCVGCLQDLGICLRYESQTFNSTGNTITILE